MGKFFEEMFIGDRVTTSGRTIGEYEVSAFAGLTGDFNPMHINKEFASSSPFGEVIAHGALGFSIAIGLMNQMGHLDGTAQAFLGIKDWRFVKAIYIGDTIRVDIEISNLRKSNRTDSGIVNYQMDLLNQHDEIVQSGDIAIMVQCLKS